MQGLKSRFPSEIDFPDYTADELMQITEHFLGEEMLNLSEDAREALTSMYTIMATVHDRENGNGRAVRNLLERAKRSQALRLMELGGKRTREELSLLTHEDFEGLLAEMSQPSSGPPPSGPRGGGGQPVAYAQ